MLPRILIRGGRVNDWDNSHGDFISNSASTAASVSECMALCQADSACVQYAFDKAGKQCAVSATPRLGQARNGIDSFWLLARTKRWADALPACGKESWSS